jgi:FkbM family methyltransferase
MGFYIDIGANDPNHLSNTKYFYNNGWMGINIEPNVELYQAFMTERPRDINLNLGIGPDESMLSFYNFDENVYSTFSREEADRRVRNGHKLIGEKKVKVDRLENILSKFLPEGRNIDFMSVDTEGFDLICLRTNNWKKFRPKYVCIETIDFGNTRVNKNNEIEKFLESVSYREVFFNGINSIYKDIQ